MKEFLRFMQEFFSFITIPAGMAGSGCVVQVSFHRYKSSPFAEPYNRYVKYGGDGMNGLTALELTELANAIQLEERLVHLYTQGALECTLPQLRSFCTYQAERAGDHLEELTSLLQSCAGVGAQYSNSKGWMS